MLGFHKEDGFTGSSQSSETHQVVSAAITVEEKVKDESH